MLGRERPNIIAKLARDRTPMPLSRSITLSRTERNMA
jgi:hypothetical protein